MAQRIAWASPELDPTLQGTPGERQGAGGVRPADWPSAASSISALGRDHVLIFFFRGDCPYCHAFAPTLEAFQARHGIKVSRVSVDGGPIPGFADARDNGIATTLRVTQVPAVYLAQPFTGKITPIGFGVLSEAQLLERISMVAASPDSARHPFLGATGGLQAQARLTQVSFPECLMSPLPADRNRSLPMPVADQSLHRAVVVALPRGAAVGPAPLRAGDLNAEVNTMFNNLGAIGNYTAPGAFRGQTFNTYTGGSLFMRSPNKVYQLAAIQFPSAKAGLRRHRRLRRVVLAHLGRRVQEHAAQHHGRAARHRVPARAGVGLAAAGRADQVGQGPGDLDQQRAHQLLRDRQGHRQHGRRGRQATARRRPVRRPGHRDGPGERPRRRPPPLRERPAEHPGLGPSRRATPTCATRRPSSAT